MKIFICIAWLCLLFACSKEEVGKVPLEGIIQVEVKEITIDDSPRIMLSCRTIKEYPCANYSIITDQEVIDEPLKITFLAIEAPHNCFTALGPARAEIDLGTLENGIYDLIINNQSLANHGSLEITDQAIVLNFPQQNGIEIINPTVQR